MQTKTLFSIGRYFYNIASPKHRRMFWWLCLLNVFMGFFEMGVAGGISLLGVAMSSPEALSKIPFLPLLQAALPFADSVPPTLSFLLIILTGIVLATVAKNCLLAYITWLQNYFGQGIAWNLGCTLFSRFLGAPYLWHTTQNSSELLTLLNWKSYIANFAVAVLTLFTQCIIAIFLLAGALAANPLMSLFLFCTITFFALCIQKYSRKKVYDLASCLREYDLYNARVSMQGLHGIREITIYDKKQAFYTAYTKYIEQYCSDYSKQAIFPNLPQWFLESAGMGLLLLVLIGLLFTHASVAETTGTLTLLAAISWRLLPAANKTMGAVLSMRSQQPIVEKLLDVLHETQSKAAPLEARPLRSFEHKIALEHISFAYPQSKQLALDDVSLTLPKGKMIGFVGLSGSGKSTLSGIITGLLQAEQGQLSIDGAVWNPAEQHLNIGYVPQNLYLSDVSLAENVAFSAWGEPIDEERVKACCGMSAMDFIDDLPQGIHTVLGERGVRLSGGQVQRVGIARALYGSPEILLFDEATSALDGATENEIQATVYSLRSSVTLIIIAHRLSTVAECDIVYWIDKGKVRMSGAPDVVLGAYGEMLTMATEHNNEAK
jgi:ATP-binding cassette, subfamily B, bacterial PglK